MSRSITGGKGSGYEYWGRRSAKGKELRQPGRYTKKYTHRKERRDATKSIRQITR